MTVPPLKNWTLNVCLKYWAENVRDFEHGGFFTRLGADGRPVPDDAKTALTHLRLLFTYSHAVTLGAGPWAREAADSCFAFLTRRVWDESNGGWRMRVGRDGDPRAAGADSRKDCYDQGFALLAMAWYHVATGHPEALDWARRSIAFLDTVLKDAEYGGYHERTWTEGEAYPLPRRQNPHMHLLEGLLAMYEVTRENEWIVRAAAIVDMMDRKFRDPETGTLREFMGRDWSRFPGPRGLVREPGHHLEWTWLLLQYRRLSGDDKILPVAEFLYGFAIRHGIESDPALPLAAYDEVGPDGAIIEPAKLLWPQTEALKAFLARWELLGDADGKMRAERHLESMFRHYINLETGVWHNRISREGGSIEPDTPTRLLYHLYMSLAETIRVLPERA